MSQILRRVIRKPEKRDLTGLSESTTERLEKKDDFPARIHLTGGHVGWWHDEVLAWLEARPRGSVRSTAGATAAKQSKLRQARLEKEAGAEALIVTPTT
jgi:predicted DNA-binding transcriptional regulator AlpA